MMLLGAVVLIALLAAYLSDCIPGLGSGGELGTPSSEAPAAPPSPSEPPVGAGEAAEDRITITVQGEQCRRDRDPAVPCPELCASIDRTHAATVEIDVEAAAGHHGIVETLRKCLQDAGFANVRVRSE
jgi:hypothetical protein